MSLLSVRREGSGPTFVWLHGFTQTRDSAHDFRTILTGTRELLTMDLPGHGSASAITTNLDQCADLVAAALPAEPVDLGGYSMGARVALHVALRHPDHVGRLVLLGATRGVEDHVGRAARRGHDEQLADRCELIGADAFLDEWLARPMFASLPGDPAERSARSTNAHGLAEALRLMGTGTQSWLAARLSEITSPVLALAGAHDPMFVVEARAIATGVDSGAFDLIPYAGHAAHLEQPHLTANRIDRYLALG